jgi:ornithine cyclodeaminase/alanine dehydrogenase-like protein (mu-crystallin family)
MTRWPGGLACSWTPPCSTSITAATCASRSPRGCGSRDDVEADLFGLCRGEHPGRTSADDITLYKSGGGAHLDLMATRFAMETLT